MNLTPCAKCGRAVPFGTFPDRRKYVTIFEWVHEDAEKLAWYCGKCKKGFCGQCALPKWQALRVKEGLSGPELARKLSANPDAPFDELPTCPCCKATLSYEPPEGVTWEKAASETFKCPKCAHPFMEDNPFYPRQGVM